MESREDGRIVLLGARRYLVERHWGRLPADMELVHPSQVACDSAGRVYLYCRQEPPLLVFSPTGELKAAWGQGLIADAHGIFIDSQDRVFLVDRDAHQIVVTDTSGEVLMRLGTRNRPAYAAPFNHPTDVALAADGEIYVSDGYGNAHVHRFSADGRHLGTWGGVGSGPGQFSTPHGVWVTADDSVLVGDRENDRVQIFDREGGYESELRGLYHPMDIWGDGAGTVYVSDQVPAIVAYDAQGTIIDRARGALNGGHGIYGDPAGNLYLAEQHPPSLTRLALQAE
jgi:peptidylglycine monooxygenase